MTHLRSILFILLVCFGSSANAQKNKKEESFSRIYVPDQFELSDVLDLLEDKGSIRKFNKYIDSLNRQFKQSVYTEKIMSETDKWQLKAYHFSGWIHDLTYKRENINVCYLATNQDTLFSLDDLKNVFLPQGDTTSTNTVFHSFPQVYKRNDYYNSRWTIVQAHPHYLVVRSVYSYPNGNQTSWYKVRSYYFEKWIEKQEE